MKEDFSGILYKVNLTISKLLIVDTFKNIFSLLFYLNLHMCDLNFYLNFYLNFSRLKR